MKRVFKFYLPDGSCCEARTKQDLIDSNVYEERKNQLEAHYLSEMHYERKWRNNELLLTDALMFVDATYNGKLVKNSEYFQEILDYRKALRQYDLKYQPRPKRPNWFTPLENL